MRLKNKKGMTAMVDAMIFIVIMGIVATVYFSSGHIDNSEMNESSEITDDIFSTKLKINDLIDTEENGLISIGDLIVSHLYSNNDSITEYLEDILRTLLQRPDSYRLELTYGDLSCTIGNGYGDPLSSCTKEHTVTFGGVLTSSLSIY